MELLSDAGESLYRGCPQSVPVPVLLFLSDYAYEDAGPSETDTGRNGICGGGAESVCLCGILFPYCGGGRCRGGCGKGRGYSLLCTGGSLCFRQNNGRD